MTEHELSTKVREFLLSEKAYPSSQVQLEVAVGDDRKLRADIAILDSQNSEFVAFLELKSIRDHQRLRSGVSQLLDLRRVVGKNTVPLYLFFPPLPSNGRPFSIAQVLPDGDTKDISTDEFPSYDGSYKRIQTLDEH